MPITITSDRIVLTDAVGTTKFDTNEGLFVSTNFVAGSVALGAVTGSATSFGHVALVNVTNVHLVASGVSPSATHILGLMRTNWAVSSNWSSGVCMQQVGNARWRSANATAVDMLVKHPSSHQTIGAGVDEPVYPQGFSLYTFYLQSGNVYCKERVQLQSFIAASGSTVYSLTKGAGTLDYRLYIGLFK